MMRALHSTKQTVFTPLCLLTGFTIATNIPFNSPAMAQIVPDNSLGNESSIVIPNVEINGINSDRIDGGAIRGTNLFHSFQEFNIDNGRGAYFTNPGNISNILTRVTGNNLSNILGTLGVLGNVNLFLINPNGIVFGPNARLDIGGSFFASTADGILFENGVEFAASNPDAPPLLTINIPIGLNFRENPGNIVNQATLTTLEDGSPLRDNNGFLIPQGLNVPQNQTLALVGGNVLFDNGVAISPGSNIEIGGLSQPGIVELNADGSLTFPSNIQQTNVALTNNSQINIRGDDGGDININAANFEMSGGSIIRAGIDEFLGSPESQVGTININAQDTISLVDGSFISNVISTDGIGKPGEINLTANSISINDGSSLGTQTFGQGDAGDINIITNSLSMTDESILDTRTFAEGNAGNVKIQASESVQLINSRIFSDVDENIVRNAGNVTIETAQLQLLEGAQIIANNSGQGNAGNITILASELVEISGTTPDDELSSSLFANVGVSGTGNAGNIIIETSQLRITDGAQTTTSNSGQGNAGNLTIQASESVQLINSRIFSDVKENGLGNAGNIAIESSQLRMTDEAQIIAANSGEGDAGNVTIRASDSVQLISGDILSNVTENTTGNAGNITIETPQLRMTDGAQVNASTEGRGNGGIITVKAENIDVRGTILSPEGRNISSGFLASSGASGNAGTIIIEAQRLRVTDGAIVEVAADNTGDAGTIIVRANDVELLDGIDTQNLSTLDASVKPIRIDSTGSGTGRGGSVTVEAERLVLRNGGRIEARTANGTGESGQITITASESVELSGISPDESFGGSIFTDTTGSADAGDITISTRSLSIRDNSGIIAGSGILSDEVVTGNGGNIQIFATDAVELVSLESQELGASINSGTFGQGNGGNISIDTGRLVLRNGRSFIGASTIGSGDAGNINIKAQQLQLLGGGIVASTRMDGDGDAGQIQINVAEWVELNGQNSFIGAGTSGNGDAGNIDITTNQLRVLNQGIISVSTSDANGGNAGEIEINAAESVSLRGEATGLLANTEGSGNAGNVSITTGQLQIRDEAIVLVNSESSGIPGNVNITATSTLLNQSFLGAISEAGKGGNIRLQSNDVRLLNGSEIAAAGSESSETFEGNIEIDADLLVLLQGSRIVTDAFSPSGGSNINIQPFNNSNIVIVQSNDSVINAAGNLTIDSSVTFKPAEVPEVTVTDPNDLIAAEFCRQRGGSEFIVTGKGGLAADPNDKADGNQIEVDLVEPVPSRPRNTSQRRSQTEDNQPISSLAPRLRYDLRHATRTGLTLSEVETLDIVPARGWVRDENGDVILVSYDPTKMGVRRQSMQHPQCQPEVND